MLRSIYLGDPSNNGAAGAHEFVIPSGQRINTLLAEVASGTVAVANLANLQLFADGFDTLGSQSGVDLNAFNAYFGLAAFDTADVIRIPLYLPKQNDEHLAMLTEWNSGVPGPDGRALTKMKLSWNDTGATTPSWRIHALVNDVTPEGPGLIRRWAKFTGTGATSLTNQKLDGIPLNDPRFMYISRIYTAASAGTISQMRVETDRGMAYDGYTAAIQAAQVMNGLTPGSTFAHVVDFSLLKGAKPLRLAAPGKVPSGDPNGLQTEGMLPFLYLNNLSRLQVSVVNSEAATNTHWVEFLGVA